MAQAEVEGPVVARREPVAHEQAIDPKVVDKILKHLRAKGDHRERGPPGRADLEAAS